MVMLSTLIGLPVSIPLGAVPLAGTSVSGMAIELTKKYHKKLTKVTKLTNIVLLGIAVFEMSLSKAFNNSEIDEQSLPHFRHFTWECLMNWPMLTARWRPRQELNCKKVYWKRSTI